VLHVPTGRADQVGPLSQVGPQLAGLLVGPEGRRQQADAVQPVDPLAVAAVRLGAEVGPSLFGDIPERQGVRADRRFRILATN
jgi:hypothetical protein